MANVVDITVRAIDQTGSGLAGVFSGISGAVSQVEQLGAVGEAVGGGLSSAFLVPVAAVAALGVAAFAVGDQFAGAYDKIRVGTGQTGEALGALENSFKTVVSTVPASFGDASAAITGLNQRLGLTGPQLEALSEQELNLARITGTDVNENVKKSAELFNNWGVSTGQQSSVLDFLFRTTQATGVGFTDLSTQVSDNGVKMRALGFSLEDTTSLFGLLSKAGINASSIMPAFSKELANSMKSGKDAQTVLTDMFNEIEHSPDKVKVGEDAIRLFGARAGPQFVAAVQEGKMNYADLENTIALGSDTINSAAHDTEHFGEKFTELKNKMMVLAEPIAMTAFDSVSNAVAALSPALDRVVSAATPFFNSIRENQGVMTAFGVVVGGLVVGSVIALGAALAPVVVSMAVAAAPFLAVAVAIGVVAAAVSYAWNNFTVFHDVVMTVVTWFQSVVPTVLDKVGGAFSALHDALNPLITFIQSHSEVFVRLGEGLAILAAIIGGVLIAVVVAAAAAVLLLVAAIMVIGVVIGAAIAVIFQIGQVLWDVFQNAKDAVATAGGAITSFFANLGQAAMAVVGAIGNFFGNLVGWISTAISAVAGAVGAIPGLIGSIVGAIAGFVGSVLSAIGNFIGSVASFFASLPGKIMAGIQMIPQLVSNMFNNMFYAIGYILGTIVRLFLELGQNIWNAIQSIPGIVSAIVGFFQALPGRVLGVLSALWGVITSVFTTAKDNAITNVTNLVTAVVQFFQELPGKVMSVLSALWDVITSVFTTAKDNATTNVTNLVTAVVGFFRELPGKAGAALSSLWSSISQAFEDAWHGAIQKTQEIEDSVVQFLSQIPGKASSALSGFAGAVRDGLASAVSAAISVGGDIVRGIASGIGSGVGFVIDAAKSAAGNIISGFKSALGIGSPSRLAAELVGRPTAEGIGVGLQAEGPALRRTLGNVVDTMMPGAALSRSLSLAAASSRGLVPVGGDALTAARAASNATLEVKFVGNTDSGFARYFMGLVRSGQIQISAAAVI